MKSTQTNKTVLLIPLFAFLLLFNSCIDDFFIEGNGISKTEYRSASGFDHISVNGDYHVTVMPGNDYSVEVTADCNLIPFIETDVIGNTLKIRTRGLYSLRQDFPIEVYITTPELKELAMSGSGLIETGNFMSNDFNIAVSGSGDIKTAINASQIKATVSGSGTISLEGNANETNFVISGSGKIKSYKLEQQHCQAIISGSGNMFVNAVQTIDARISGSGRVYYINHPAIHTSISGSGNVIDKN